MESWQQLLRKQSIASLEALVAKFGAEHFPDLERLRQAAENFEFRISPAMVDLIKSPGDPIWRQYVPDLQELEVQDRKSTRLNSSHANISYAVFCLKKKKHHKSAPPEIRLSASATSRTGG